MQKSLLPVYGMRPDCQRRHLDWFRFRGLIKLLLPPFHVLYRFLLQAFK